MSAPRKARIFDLIVCDNCGEAAIATRVREAKGMKLYTPCFEAMKKRVDYSDH